MRNLYDELSNDFKELERNKNIAEQDKLKLDAIINRYTIFGYILISLGVVAFFIPLLPVSNFNLYGDFVGGVVSSIWSLAGLIFIYVAFLGQRQQLIMQQIELKHTQYEAKSSRVEIVMQNEQLKEQNKTLALQRFENTFFQLLQTQNQIVSNMDLLINIGDGNIISKGKDCFRVFYKNHFKSKIKVAKRNILIKENSNSPLFGFSKEDIDKVKIEKVDLINIYESLYGDHEGDLGHYFNNLNHLMGFVDNADQIEDTRKYVEIIRAQLSSFELVFIFFHGISSYGKVPFKPLVEKYGVLHNLNIDLLLNKNLKKMYEQKAFSE